MKTPLFTLVDAKTLNELRKIRDTKALVRQHKEKIAKYRDSQIAKLMKQHS